MLGEEGLCVRKPMAFLKPHCMLAMCLAPCASTRRHLGSTSSSSSARAVAQCTQVHVRCYCCSRREPRGQCNRLTTGTANYTSRSLFLLTNWPTGNRGSKREELQWKKSGSGNWEAGASIFETPTVI